MSAESAADLRRLTEDTAVAQPRASSNAWWGMMTLIATEGTLFVVFIASYWFLRWEGFGTFPPPGIEEPKLMRPAIMTGLLLTSSVTAHLAEQAIRQGNQGRLRTLLAATTLLGILFLCVQGWEYSHKIESFEPGRNAYASLFYLITGFHASHVLAGLMLLVWVQIGAWTARYTQRRHLGVQIAVLYWHFVDVVWVTLIVPSLYLSEQV